MMTKSIRWQRRLMVWPLLMLGTPVLLLMSPLLFFLAGLVDVLSGRPLRLRAIRLVGMGLSYLVFEWCGMVVGFVLWLATGCGLALRTKPSQQAHHRVQMIWASCIFAAVRFWFGADVRVEGADEITAAPAIIVARHTSFFDALLPAVILGKSRPNQIRHVLAVELLWDPCLDLFGHRLPNYFVHRQSNYHEADQAALLHLAEEAGDDDLVIFPEGTFHTPARARRAEAWLRAHEPERADRLHLAHLLPPRATGLLTLFQGAPDAELVLLNHTGFEAFGSVREILRNVPFRDPIHIECWRVARSDIDDDDAGRMALMDRWWQRLDEWIDEQRLSGAGASRS